MTEGDYVFLHAAHHDAVGVILDIRPPAELPELLGVPGAPDVSHVIKILGELDVRNVVVVGYNLEGRKVMFAALELADGTWRDLRGQTLEISPHRRGEDS